MRPDILNPLFAEVEVLKGIGPALAKPLHRLGLNRVVDILFHLPVSWIDRKRVETLDEADVGRTITVALTARDYRQSGGRGPFRIFAEDKAGNYVTLTYFNNPGWGKKQLPLGEARIVSGRLDRYGQELQMVHPDYVLKPAEAATDPRARAGLSACRKGSPTTASAISPARRWRGGRPSPNGSSRASRRSRAGRTGPTRWRPPIATPPRPRRASGSLMTRCSPTSSP